MGEKGIRDPLAGLKVGRGISISPLVKSKDKVAAIVTNISHAKIFLKLPRRISQLPFREGERVRINYWEEGIIYCWDAEVVKITSSRKQRVAVSTLGEGMTLQWRNSVRVRASIPFSFTVVDAAESGLIGEKVLNTKTQDISTGGLAFQTSLLFKAGDKLEIDLHLASQRVSAFGWVVRCELLERDPRHINLVAIQFLQLKEK
ncbi:PilZ domain-containing protein, partial [Acidobacteria bacterium AH-259-L09]|nr:PilZ domain-containing protein [Acidobacteria bacterium AH-259-L09]